MKRETTLDNVEEESEVGQLITEKWRAQRSYNRLRDGVRALLNERVNTLSASQEDDFEFFARSLLEERVLVDIERLIASIEKT